MAEAENYQQRLQAITERRRQQEEETRLTRETEEERLKTAQEKRKYLREQWLSESPAVLPSHESGERRPPPQNEAVERTTAEPSESQETPEDEEPADAREEERASQEHNAESVNFLAAADEDVRVNKEAEDHFSIQMAQRMFHESGQDGRSVLGMVAVQVERDPKTGATVVRSVAPLSAPAGAPTATAVFDDGRKSVHAVGGSGAQPSTEELGQILSFVDGVGMKVLLDEVTITADEAEVKTQHVDANRDPEERVVSFSTHHAVSKEDSTQLDSSRGDDWEAVDLPDREDEREERGIMAVKDIAGEVGNVEDLRLEEGPVTLMFMGYTDGDQGDGQEDYEGMLTVERVMITEEGEEHVLGPETSDPPQAEKESQVFQDIPLDGNRAGVKVQGEEEDEGLHNSSSPTAAEGAGTSKRKACQCCSVM